MAYKQYPNSEDAVQDAYILEVASANTTVNAFSAQEVKTPVTISIVVGMTGTLTIDGGEGTTEEVLRWDNTNGQHKPTAIFYVKNMNQLRYTFSVNAGTEKFTVQAGM